MLFLGILITIGKWFGLMKTIISFLMPRLLNRLDYLVTNDHHFDEAIKKGFPFVNIISASKFKTIIEK
jgi:hypothetical protein